MSEDAPNWEKFKIPNNLVLNTWQKPQSFNCKEFIVVYSKFIYKCSINNNEWTEWMELDHMIQGQYSSCIDKDKQLLYIVSEFEYSGIQITVIDMENKSWNHH